LGDTRSQRYNRIEAEKTPPMQIVDLRQVHSRILEPLFQEEARHWLQELHWDYRPSLDLIRKFIDSRSLGGYVAFDNRHAAGYGFYVLEDQKGLIGDLFVPPQLAQATISHKLLSEMLLLLRSVPHIHRIEAQLMPFGAPLDPVLISEKFCLHTRQFMLLSLAGARLLQIPLSLGMDLERWNDRAFDQCARLMQLAYASHVDGEINDQYRSEAGAVKFLRNIVVLPGCGQFLPEASFVVRPRIGDRPIGMVLTSRVSEGVGHTTQICVMPGYQGHGIGRHMMEASIRALQGRGFHSLSLTVTAVNASAVQLYEKIGFRTIKSFAAAVWQA
jgi:ribosomal protein S18 acetylase RimI-like enzyme